MTEKDKLKFQKAKLNDIQKLINEFEDNNYGLTDKQIDNMNNALKEGHKID